MSISEAVAFSLFNKFLNINWVFISNIYLLSLVKYHY